MMDLRSKIMLRVYAIWLFRRVVPVIIFQILFLILALHLFVNGVYFIKVFENAATALELGKRNFLWFALEALWHAKVAVKSEIVAMLILGFYMFRYIRKALVSYELIRRNQ